MNGTGTTHTIRTARNGCDALDFISVGDALDIDGVRLLCVILKRTTCDYRLRRAEMLLAVKLSNADNLSFVEAFPGGENILTRIALRP